MCPHFQVLDDKPACHTLANLDRSSHANQIVVVYGRSFFCNVSIISATSKDFSSLGMKSSTEQAGWDSTHPSPVGRNGCTPGSYAG
jgi:hypothetical protein